MIGKRDVGPLGAIGLILAVTAAWWGFALWAVPGAPSWLERARAVCFNITESGLPDRKGWLLLAGQPPIMLALLLVGWRDAVRESLGRLLGTGAGRAGAGAVLGLCLVGLALAAARVAEARVPAVSVGLAGPAPAGHPRLDRPWPEAGGLVDQTGAVFSAARLAGRPALVTFAFGHCETVCPVVVRQVLAAREVLSEADAASAPIPVVVYTLDPWRDTPSRLEALRRQWGLDPDADHVVGGPVAAVESALDSWGVQRTRDERTGDVVHPAVVYLVDSDGTVAFASTGGVERLVSLGERLR